MRADFFERFGFFARAGLLDPEECASLREEMAGAAAKVSTVAEGGTADEVDEGQRSSRFCPRTAYLRRALRQRRERRGCAGLIRRRRAHVLWPHGRRWSERGVA